MILKRNALFCNTEKTQQRMLNTIIDVIPTCHSTPKQSHQLSVGTSKHSFDEINVKTRFPQIICCVHRIQYFHKIILKQGT